MSNPSDTIRLLHDLEATAEAIRDIQRRIEAIITEVKGNEDNDIADRLAKSAIAAGMPPARAFGYAEEYTARTASARTHLGTLVEHGTRASDAVTALIHIATVVPHRCPNPGTALGRPALVLTN
jgi:hypothetical protein